MLIEQLPYNVLFRWFVGMEMSHTVSHGRREFSGVGVGPVAVPRIRRGKNCFRRWGPFYPLCRKASPFKAGI